MFIPSQTCVWSIDTVCSEFKFLWNCLFKILTFRNQNSLPVCNFFISKQFFSFKKMELTRWAVPIPNLWIPNLWTNSLGIRFWDFCLNFEIAWVEPICVGVVISNLSNALNFLCWSFSYIKLTVFIRFHVNPRNFYTYPRKIHFLASFSVETI